MTYLRFCQIGIDWVHQGGEAQQAWFTDRAVFGGYCHQRIRTCREKEKGNPSLCVTAKPSLIFWPFSGNEKVNSVHCFLSGFSGTFWEINIHVGVYTFQCVLTTVLGNFCCVFCLFQPSSVDSAWAFRCHSVVSQKIVRYVECCAVRSICSFNLHEIFGILYLSSAARVQQRRTFDKSAVKLTLTETLKIRDFCLRKRKFLSS